MALDSWPGTPYPPYMGRPPRYTYAGAYHHIAVRCNNREFQFTDDGLFARLLALIADAYSEVTETDAKGKSERRVILKFHPRVAPIKVAVLPLLKNKPELVAQAKEVFTGSASLMTTPCAEPLLFVTTMVYSSGRPASAVPAGAVLAMVNWGTL